MYAGKIQKEQRNLHRVGGSINTMSGLRLPRLISNGMVLQKDKKQHIWGWDEPGSRISVDFMNEKYEAVAGAAGRFELWLKEQPYGGPYTMTVSNDRGECIRIGDILIGEVWLCSGQSNMELPMARVKDRYPEEMTDCDYPQVREFKIQEALDFIKPLDDSLTGKWRKPGKEYIGEFSATAYFFARELNRLTGIPVGFIDASLGGSKIHCWMSREMLKGYDDKLAEADRYSDEQFRKSVLESNIEVPLRWHNELDSKDRGRIEHWEAEGFDDSSWRTVILPAFLKDTEIGDTLGVIYFRKSFIVPAEMAGKEAKLWLGTMVDSDRTFVNGKYVGSTDYQYPPRKYVIPANLLHEGINNVTVRLKAEYLIEFGAKGHSAARFTPGKEYKVFNEENTIDLSGEWKYMTGASADSEAPRQDFVSWKPAGLYNAMTAPCTSYVIGGVNWYQGESDCEERDEYTELFRRMVEGYRKEWSDDKLPVNVVQLPNFTIDNDPCSEAWQGMREVLRRLGESIEGCDSIVTIDLGEDNDLHPQEKRELGRRLALLAARNSCGLDIECHGPSIKKFMCVRNGDEAEITINMSGVGEGLKVCEAGGKGSDGRVTDLILTDEDGNSFKADVTVNKDRLILKVRGLKHSVKEIRYCYSQTNTGALIYNSEGLPMSPGIYVL